LHQNINSLKTWLNSRIVGQQQLIERIIIALLADGHLLVEGAPGLAKTKAIKTVSEGLDADFHRVQFTPDLLPSDITGSDIYRPEQGVFEFQAGPLFHNLVLADEINRAPAKVQSALLEAMAERQISVGKKSYALPDLFLVMATQNPIEQEGTYPLPEAQLDRFMFNLKIGYPKLEDEIEIVRNTTSEKKEKINPVLTRDQIIDYQNLVRRVPVSDNVVKYAVKIVSATRPTSSDLDFIKNSVDWGEGPRASQYLILAAKAKALLDGRPTPDIQDIQTLVPPILRHRVLPNFNAEAEGLKIDDILVKLIKALPE
jgi:MoxR-like ATPase